MEPPSACSCPRTQRPVFSSRPPCFPSLSIFSQQWVIPSCFWTCQYRFMDSDALPNQVNQLADIRHGLGHLDVLEEFLGLNKMQDCLHSMLNDVKQSQKLSRPSCDPSNVTAPFCMDSPYPPSPFAHSTYRYPYLRTMWLQFCRCRGLACWIDILPSTIRCFLPQLLKLTNYLWNLLYYIPHVQKPTAPYTHRQYKATLHMLTRSLHITLGVDMELHAPFNHHSVL